MSRLSRLLTLLVALQATLGWGAPPTEIVVRKPGSASPATDLEDAGLQKQYDDMWETFESAVTKTSDDLAKALHDLKKKAQDDGNLDLALHWNEQLELFKNSGSVNWDSAGDNKKTWKERFKDTPFPDDFASTLATIKTGYDKATEALNNSYNELVKKITMSGDLDKAKKVKDEGQAVLAGQPVPPSPDPKKPDSGQRQIAQRLQGKWARAEFPDDYNFSANGEAEAFNRVSKQNVNVGKWKALGDNEAEVRWRTGHVWQVRSAGEQWVAVRETMNARPTGDGIVLERHAPANEALVYLADLPVKQSVVGWDRLIVGRAPDHPVNGKVFDKAIWANATSRVVFDLPENFKGTLRGAVGIAHVDPKGDDPCKCAFKIYGGDQVLWTSEVIQQDKTTRQSMVQSFEIPLLGCKQIALEVDSLGPNTRDYSMWLDPVLIWLPQARAKK